MNLVEKYAGRPIECVTLMDDVLVIRFQNNSAIRLLDRGQDCCERRYMTTDDDLHYFSGALLLSAEVLDAPSIDAGDESHDVQFLHVTTSKGVFTVSTHNEHNGYYGGFDVVVEDL
jgi:hypothetical protein